MMCTYRDRRPPLEPLPGESTRGGRGGVRGEGEGDGLKTTSTDKRLPLQSPPSSYFQTLQNRREMRMVAARLNRMMKRDILHSDLNDSNHLQVSCKDTNDLRLGI